MIVFYATRLIQIIAFRWAWIRGVLWWLGGALLGIPIVSYLGRALRQWVDNRTTADRHAIHEAEMEAKAEDKAHADGLTSWWWAVNQATPAIQANERGILGLQEAQWDMQRFRDGYANPTLQAHSDGIATLTGAVNALQHHATFEADPAIERNKEGISGVQEAIWTLRHHVEQELDPSVARNTQGILGLQTGIQNLEGTWSPARSASLSQVETNVLARPVEWIGSMAQALAPALYPPILPLLFFAMENGSSDDPGYIGYPRVDP